MSTPTSKQVIYLVPTGTGVGLTSVSMGFVRAIDRTGINVSFFKPFAQLFRGDVGPERSTYMIRHTTDLNPPDPIPYGTAEQMLTTGKADDLMEEVVEMFHNCSGEADVTVVEGLINMDDTEYAAVLNKLVARALDASVIFVGVPVPGQLDRLETDLHNTAEEFGGVGAERTLGAILNFVNAPRDESGSIRPDLGIDFRAEILTRETICQQCKIFDDPNFHLLGAVPWQQSMAVSRTDDIAQHLHATILHEGQMKFRRVHHVYLCARNVQHIMHVFKANALLLIPIDRIDLFISACMAAINGLQLSGIILTSCDSPREVSEGVLELCASALASGLPVMTVPSDSYTTATRIPLMNAEVPINDSERIEMGMNHVASNVSRKWIQSLGQYNREPRLSPAAFRYRLVQLARQANKRIVLPEGDEPRTIQAASHCVSRGIARCVLLGNPEKIRESADMAGIELAEELEIVDPAAVREKYVDPLVELRKHKGLDRTLAESQLEDNIMLGTMMLQQGDVDGLVSGAVHSTAATVRPALQLIKSRPESRFVSSCFFMLLPEQVVIYADCAIHENPDAQTLAEIAVQSADSAAAFNIPTRVAMISYSTGDSGTGTDVQKVKEATRIAKEMRPNLEIDGPLQYDAASTASVAATKAPDSPVAGKATVFVFPDLNTGNTTYKAVQRSANVVSIGPMLQGLNKPVNDLSRGALVDDIVYTIALTAIQGVQ